MTTSRSASAAPAPIPVAFLGRPASDPRRQALGFVDLAGVCAKRVELPIQRGGDVDPGVGAIGPEEVEPPDAVRRKPRARERREGHRVAGGRVDGVDRGQAGRPMVGVVDPAALVEERVGIGGEDGIRPEGADLADELLAQRQVVGQRPVRLVEERDPGVADDRRRRALLGLAQRGEHERVGVGILAALVAARAAHQPALRTRVDPARRRPGGPELGVVRVRRDDHEAIRPPGVVDRRRRLGHDRDATRFAADVPVLHRA